MSKLNQTPSWYPYTANISATRAVNAQVKEAVESVRRTAATPEDPGQSSAVSRQAGVTSRELKPGLLETTIKNSSYT